MIEANYQREILEHGVEEGLVPVVVRNRIRRSHFDLEHLKEFFKANDLCELQEVWLLHLSENNSDEEQFKREIQEIVGKPVYIA
jgi:phosphoribosyl 1,2-cyclic phosphodiesterase